MGRLDLVAGARLDRYELMFPLAEGGMAAVWLARLRGKRGFEQLVAIKTIKAHLSEDMRFEQMFLDEARIASRIRHPNIAQILDLGEEQGILYLVMEWVDGSSLSRTRRFIEKRGSKIPLRIALRIMADVAAGLHAAHELKDEAGANLGVIHRDVSPQNILVSTSGSVKVIDFGIAKARNRATAETTDGLVKGKVAYMSPEQADGLPIDRRADVWSVGVCLYELLTGKLPFDGDSQQEILRLLVKGTAVPPLPTEIPTVVRGMVEQALARNPADRFLTAAALGRALEGALATLDSPTTSDDVATFLAKTCPEQIAARKEVLASVERITESLDAPQTKDITPAKDAKSAKTGEVQTRDITPPGQAKAVTGTQATQATMGTLSTLGTEPSDSVDVRFSDPGKEPMETAVTHSASVSKAADRVAPSSRSSRSRGVLLGAVAIVAIGAVSYVALSRRVPDPTGAATTSASTGTPTSVAKILTSSSPTASASETASAGPTASASGHGTSAAPPASTSPLASLVATTMKTAPSRPPIHPHPGVTPAPKPSAAKSTGGVQYDPDGIPIAPKGGVR